MSKRNDLVPMGDMLDAAREVEQILLGVDRGIFDRERTIQLSVLHLLQTIGEAARRVSEESRSAHPEIDWKDMIGMRSRLVHDYMNIDFNAVWKAATVDVPRLIAQLRAFMPSDPP
jgi:uncharacterized protein with HEPN domain